MSTRGKYPLSICLAIMTLTVCQGRDAAKSGSTGSKPAFEDGKTTDIPLLSRPVTVDGNIDSGEWKGALYLTDFKEQNDQLVKSGTVSLKTEAWIGRTDTDLCLAFRCVHDQPARMVMRTTKHDGNVWTDDSVEVVMDTQGGKSSYYQVIANAAGVLFDQYCSANGREDVAWESGASSAGRIIPEGFIIEIKIPLSALNLGLNPTGIINMNLCRNVAYLNSNQSRFGQYGLPATWQAFRIPGAGPKTYPLTAEDVKWNLFAGNHETAARFRNLTKTAVAVTGSWEVVRGSEQRVEPVKLDVPGDGTGELPLRYSVAKDDNISLRLRLSDKKGREILSMDRTFQETDNFRLFPGAIRLILPPRIYAVPGIEMNVYFDNVCLAVNPANYVFNVTCAKGLQQTERWTIVPTTNDIGQFPFGLEVRDEANKVIARAESILQIVPRDAGAGMPLRVLTIGDSLTHASAYPAHLLELCKAEGNPQITLVGHVPDEKKPDVRIEGYGGWTAGRFMTHFKAEKRPEGQVDWRVWNDSGSPFLYSDGQGKFKADFAQYCQERNGGKSPDFVTIYLGVNDVAGGASDENIDKSIDSMFKYYDEMIAMVHAVRKDTWVGAVLLVPPAATQDAFGENNKCGMKRWQGKRNQQRLVERMIEKYGGREAEFICLVPANVNMDCLHNCSTHKKPWNSRTEEEAVRLNNAWHPGHYGYRQIGDTIYCWIKAIIAK